jgi:hypothetical protein
LVIIDVIIGDDKIDLPNPNAHIIGPVTNGFVIKPTNGLLRDILLINGRNTIGQ